MATTKRWYESKTMIVNLLGATAASLELIDINVLAAFGVTNPIQSMAIIGFVVSIVNMYLRTISVKPITRKKKTNEVIN